MTIFMILGIIGICLFCFFAILKSIVIKQKQEIKKRFQGKDILKMSVGANCFGQETVGLAQVRGNGTLVLTEEGLFFKMWMPQKTIMIDMAEITGLEIVKSHLGKTKFCPLLKVSFTNQEGVQDSVAWLVPDPNDWSREIQRFLKA